MVVFRSYWLQSIDSVSTSHRVPQGLEERETACIVRIERYEPGLTNATIVFDGGMINWRDKPNLDTIRRSVHALACIATIHLLWEV